MTRNGEMECKKLKSLLEIKEYLLICSPCVRADKEENAYKIKIVAGINTV